MRRLSALDAAFLYMETRETPMHAVGLQFFELPENYGGSFIDEFRKYLLDRVHLVPFLHEHLRAMPLGFDHPVWVTDPALDIDYHLRHLALPAPGGTAELTHLAETLYPPLLDRARPLWEYTIIEGLRSGHVVLYAKAHHACLDGMASQRMLDTFYSDSPESTLPESQLEEPEPEPRSRELLRDSYSHLRKQRRIALRSLPDVARSALKLGRRALEGRLPSTAPRTRFDVEVTDRRRFAITSLSLRRVKRVAKASGVTVNDVVMSICGGALRRYLSAKGELPDDPLIGFAPVSLRAKDDTELNNQVFGMLTPLATNVADPVERLQAVHAGAADAKGLLDDLRGAISGDLAFPGAPGLMRGVFGAMSALHLPERMPQLFNVTISNVPGLQKPLYVSGARLVGQYPMSIVQHGCALNITVMGIQDALDFGLVGCARAVPDIDVLCAHLSDAFAELEEAVG